MIMGVNPRTVFFLGFIAAALPSVWFIATSYFAVTDTVEYIHDNRSQETLTYLKALVDNQRDVSEIEIIVRAHLEYDTLNNRQGRSNSALASRTWLRFMSSGFGSIVIFIGAVYVLARIETKIPTNIDAEGVKTNLKVSLRSTSPGIVMVLIGGFLMITPNFAKQNIRTHDVGTYLGFFLDEEKIEVHDRVSPAVNERLEALRQTGSTTRPRSIRQ